MISSGHGSRDLQFALEHEEASSVDVFMVSEYLHQSSDTCTLNIPPETQLYAVISLIQINGCVWALIIMC